MTGELRGSHSLTSSSITIDTAPRRFGSDGDGWEPGNKQSCTSTYCYFSNTVYGNGAAVAGQRKSNDGWWVGTIGGWSATIADGTEQ